MSNVNVVELHSDIIWWQHPWSGRSVWKCPTWYFTSHQSSATSNCSGWWYASLLVVVTGDSL